MEENQKIRLRLCSFDGQLIERSANVIAQIVRTSGSDVSGPIPLPTVISRYTVLKSPHGNKTSREQFEKRVHKRLLDIGNPSQATLEKLRQLEIPMGVDIEIQLKKK